MNTDMDKLMSLTNAVKGKEKISGLKTPIPRNLSRFSLQSESMNQSQKDQENIFHFQTVVGHEVKKRYTSVNELLSKVPLKYEAEVSAYMPTHLHNAIFCGHLVTDLDSIAGSIGAAELYGGIAARASEINSETAFALKYFNVEQPRPIEELLIEYPKAGICLVDHQQTSQINKSIDVDRIVGVIDHHALQNSTIVSDKPIYIDIRPWGSMSSIITHGFIMLKRRPPKPIAGILLCAILSDTLNLQGPTTTEWDRLMVAILVQIADVTDIQQLASDQFKAKSSLLADMTAEALCTGDQKAFFLKTNVFSGNIGFAVIETTDDEIILTRTNELIFALQNDKDSKGFVLLFLAVVNIVSLRSHLMICGPAEHSLASAAFTNGTMLSNSQLGERFGVTMCQEESVCMDLKNLVSRKNDFVPAVTRAIKEGWQLPVVSADIEEDGDFF